MLLLALKIKYFGLIRPAQYLIPHLYRTTTANGPIPMQSSSGLPTARSTLVGGESGASLSSPRLSRVPEAVVRDRPVSHGGLANR